MTKKIYKPCTKTEILYQCNNCKGYWNYRGINCSCYIEAMKNHTKLFEKVKYRLGKTNEHLDYDEFINNLSPTELHNRKKNNELFKKSTVENSIKIVIVTNI
jgi:hypothetical protein